MAGDSLMPNEIVVTVSRSDKAAESEQRSMLMALLSDEERQRNTIPFRT
jgi:hypothetical protein